jgi:formylglycine-generating enzyme required for sulfatase activity
MMKLSQLKQKICGAVAVMLLMTCRLGLAQSASDTAVLPQEVIIRGVEFVLIPQGWFYKTGGQPQPGQEFLIHEEYGVGNVRVWLDSFYLAKYEARARDLVAHLNSADAKGVVYAGSTLSCSARLGPDGKYVQFRPDEDLPATHLSWRLADNWARWMGFRLASEMEWEKGARGADQRTYPWGDDYPDDTFAGYKTSSDCHTWPVNSFLKGRSPYGLHNMAGNVREFVADWYDIARDRQLKDGDRNPAPAVRGTTQEGRNGWDAGPWKILKGGRWASHEEQIRIGARIYYRPEDAFRCNGTRFAMDVAVVREHLAKGTASVTVQ